MCSVIARREEYTDRRNMSGQRTYSIFDLFANCIAHITKPTCAQSFDPHSLQNGIPSTIVTITSFCKRLSCNTTVLPPAKSFMMIGISEDFLSSALSHKPNVVTPSSRLLFEIPSEALLVFVVFFLFPDKFAISPLRQRHHHLC